MDNYEVFNWALKLDAPYKALSESDSQKAAVLLTPKQLADHKLANAIFTWAYLHGKHQHG